MNWKRRQINQIWMRKSMVLFDHVWRWNNKMNTKAKKQNSFKICHFDVLLFVRSLIIGSFRRISEKRMRKKNKKWCRHSIYNVFFVWNVIINDDDDGLVMIDFFLWIEQKTSSEQTKEKTRRGEMNNSFLIMTYLLLYVCM